MGDYTEHLISMAGGDGEPDALDLDAIQARADAASPGPWKAGSEVRGDCVVWGPNGKFLMNQQAAPHWVDAPGDQKRAVSFDVDKRDGEFIAAARTDVPALLALVREQQARIERVEAQLADWASMKPFPDVEESQRWYSLGKRHAADSIRAALTATEGAA